MKTPIKKFAPYTATNSPTFRAVWSSLKKFAGRIKTRALRAGQLGCAVSALAMIWSLAACEDDDEAKWVVQRHDTAGTVPVRVIIGAGPPADVYDACRSRAEFCTDPRCPEWYREVKP